ncbi:MAG: hypothetical protein QGH25_12960, partial [Candidatus Latescibacteria bacterium]|nr:hypothetical protein [Candidatus Latescibacterota bacterium]
MADVFTQAFEKLWIALRARWCDSHDLGGALAFTHDRAKTAFFHRVVQVDVPADQVDRLIDDALRLFREKDFECAFTLSPLDRPANLAERLEQRGFRLGMRPVAMICDQPAEPLKSGPAQVAESESSQYDIWTD